MSAINWKFVGTGTYDFGDLSNPESQQNVLSQRLGEVEVPRRHGVSVQTTPFLAARQIILRGSIGALPGENENDLRTRIDDFFRSILAEGRGKLHEWDNRYLWATAESVALSYREGAGMLVADFSINFLCDDPFWYGTTRVAMSGKIIGGTPLNLAMNNVDNTLHVPISNSIVSTPPKIAFWVLGQPLTACTATLAGRTFSWAQTPGLVTNQALIIDMATKDVLIGTITGGPDIGTSNRTGLTTTADFFELAAGNNTITFTSPVEVDITVYYRPRWA